MRKDEVRSTRSGICARSHASPAEVDRACAPRFISATAGLDTLIPGMTKMVVHKATSFLNSQRAAARTVRTYDGRRGDGSRISALFPWKAKVLV